MTRVPCLRASSATDALLARTVHFLPSARQARAAPGSDETDQAIQALADAIRQHRQPSAEACSSRSLTTRLPLREGGFGSTLSSLIKPYLWSLLQGRVPLGVQPLPIYGSRRGQARLKPASPAPLASFVNRSACAEASLECFLLPLTNCSAELRANAPALSLGGRWTETVTHDGLLAKAALARVGRAAERAGRFASVALLLAALLQPNAALRRAVCAARRAMGWPRRGSLPGQQRPLLLGLHVRHGDSCTVDALSRHNRSCEPLAAYLPALRALKAAYGRPNERVVVYLATDDEKVVADALRDGGGGKGGGGGGGGGRGNRGGDGGGGGDGDDGGSGGGGEFTWLVRREAAARRVWPRNGRGELHQIEDLLRHRLVDGHADATAVLVDLLLLAQCDALVGKFSSNVDRLALSLLAARRGGGAGAGAGGGAEHGSRAGTSQLLRGAAWCAADAAGEPSQQRASSSSGRALAWPAGPEPPQVCVPPFISLDHPWCAEWYGTMPLTRLGAQEYAGPTGDGGAEGRLVGGFQC